MTTKKSNPPDAPLLAHAALLAGGAIRVAGVDGEELVMQISAVGLALIRRSEGFSATVYDDPAGIPTIGYGHKLLQGEPFPNGITEAEAEALLMKDLALPQNTLTLLVPSSCTQGQFDALCDFTFNMGIARLRTLLSHGWSQVIVQLPRWIYGEVSGQEVQLPGLITRRAAEVALFQS